MPVTFIALAVALIIIIRNWRHGIVILFFWLYIEDLIRRALPGQPAQVMLIKDLVIFFIYCSFVINVMAARKSDMWKPPILGTFMLFAIFVIFDSFNDLIPNRLVAMIGVRNYLFYTPLLYLGYYFFADIKDQRKFLKVLVYTAIPLFLLALTQYILFYGSNHWLIRPFETDTQVHHFYLEERGIRQVPSVFGNAQRYARFTLLLFLLGIGLILGRQVRQKYLFVIPVACAWAGLALSGRGTAFGLSFIGIVIIFLLSFYPGGNRSFLKKSNLTANLVPLLAIVLSLCFVFFSTRSLFTYYKYQGAIDSRKRLVWVVQDFSGALAHTSVLGNGTGTISPGLGYISGGEEWLFRRGISGGLGFETGLSRIVFELGFLGFIVFYLFIIHMLIYMLRQLKSLEDSDLVLIGSSIFAYSFGFMLWFSLIHHANLGDGNALTIFWFFIGVVFGLKRLERQSQHLRYPERINSYG